MCETEQSTRDENYSHVLSKSIRDGVDQITLIIAALPSKRSAMKPSERENVAKMSRKARSSTRDFIRKAKSLL
jgi:hypothetical protein